MFTFNFDFRHLLQACVKHDCPILLSILKTDMSIFKFRPQVIYNLRMKGVNTVNDVLSISDDDLCEIHGIGIVTISEIHYYKHIFSSLLGTKNDLK